jgi:hypothetical protein
MKSVCSNCGGELVHGNALGACARCGHALTGALWTIEPPSRRSVTSSSVTSSSVTSSSVMSSSVMSSGTRSRLVAQVVAGLLAGCVASVILFGLIRAENEAAESHVQTSQHALRPAPGSTGLSPARNASGTPGNSVAKSLGNAPLLHANAPARALGAIANTDGGGTH